jgi:hypothetical protein
MNFAQRVIPLVFPHSMALARKSGTLLWTAEASALPPGSYYVSAGRVTGPCDLRSGTQIIASTRSTEGTVLEDLSLGASVVKVDGSTLSLSVECYQQRGFNSGLTDPPLVLPYFEGRMLQLYRSFVSIWLAILAGLYLLLSVFTLAPPTLTESNRPVMEWGAVSLRQKLRNPFLVFSTASVFYAISLSYSAWLVVPSQWGTFIHVMVRTALSYTFLALGQSFTSTRRPYRTIYLILSIVFVGSMLASPSDARILWSFYKVFHVIFGLTTLVLWFDSKSATNYGRVNSLFSSITLMWAMAQISDTVSVILLTPAYSSPLLLAIISFAVSSVRRAEVDITYQIERVVGRIIDTFSKSNIPVDLVVKEVSEILDQETDFSRVSVYIDGYCIGRVAEPNKLLLRIFQHGYAKDAARDDEIRLEDGMGTIMLEAMRTGRIVFRKGIDLAWFCVIPIGSLGCINLSDAEERRTEVATDSYRMVQRLRPAIRLLEDKLLTANLQRNVFLQRIKAMKGFGTWPISFGTIRIDIENSSWNTTKFQLLNKNRDVYGEFVHGIYIPALLKALSGYADLEEQMGDELYLIVLPELLKSNVSVPELTARALERLSDFIQTEGALLCAENGFEPIGWVGGASHGNGNIVCDQFKVRTTGIPANIVKRLMDSAKKGTILVDDAVAAALDKSYLLGEQRDILVKRDFVRARAFFYGVKSEKAA